MDSTQTSPLGTSGSESLIARYRHWYAHEKYANDRMLTMIESVPEAVRTDPRFARVVQLAVHLAAGRENFLELLQGGELVSPWWSEDVSVDSLRLRFAAVEAGWSAYLDSLTDETLTQDVVLREGVFRYQWNREGQVFQLLGHAYYHRGQISLLVDQLCGTTVDTDYADWAIENDSQFGEITD